MTTVQKWTDKGSGVSKSQSESSTLGEKYQEKRSSKDLQKDLHEHEMETKEITQYWKGEYDRVTASGKKRMTGSQRLGRMRLKPSKLTLTNPLLAMRAEWEQQWHVQQKGFSPIRKLYSGHPDQKDDLVTKITNEEKVLEARCAESSAKRKDREQEFIKRQADWNSKYQSVKESKRTMNQFDLEN